MRIVPRMFQPFNFAANRSIPFRMIQRMTDYPGYLLRFNSRSGKKDAVLLLHGFPANRGSKNLDLAYWIHEATDAPVYLLHYRGLGESPGEFLYKDAVEEAIDVSQRISSQFGHRLHAVVGHSFGGLTAMNVAVAQGAALPNLVLASPLVDLDETNHLYTWIFREVRKDCPGIFGSRSEEELKANLVRLLGKYAPRKIVGKIHPDTRTTIIQASNDDRTPASFTQGLLPLFRKPPDYCELEMDHSFNVNRHAFAKAVLAGILAQRNRD